MFSEDLLSQIQTANPIEQIVASRVALKKTGKYLKGLCPFHQEKTPSFTVSPDKGIFHCFGCHEGGNVFHFLMKLDQLNFAEAVEILAERVGIEVKGIKNNLQQNEKNKWYYDIHKFAAWFYHCQLKKLAESHPAQQYLKQRRISATTVETFTLGYADDKNQLSVYLRSKGFSHEQMMESKLIMSNYGTDKEFFRGRLIYPIFRPDRKVVALGGRLFEEREKGPKYLNSPESPVFHKSNIFYGLDHAKTEISKTRKALIVEGYMDVISLHQAGITLAIAPLGTALTPKHIQLLKRYCDEITLAFDADAAGIKARERSLIEALAQGFFPKFLEIPENEDPDSFIHKYGSAHFEKIWQERRNLLETTIDNTVTRCGNDLAKKIQGIRMLEDLLKNIPDPLGRKIYQQYLANAMAIDEKWLHPVKNPTPKAPAKALDIINKNAKDLNFSVEEKAILKLWLRMPALRDEILEHLQLGALPHEQAQQKIADLIKIHQENRELGRDDFYLPTELAQSYSAWLTEEDPLETLEQGRQYFLESLELMRIKFLQAEMKNLAQLAKSSEQDAMLVELQGKIKELAMLKQNRKSGYVQEKSRKN